MNLPPADQDRIKKASAAVLQKLAGKAFFKDLIDQIQKALAEYRASH